MMLTCSALRCSVLEGSAILRTSDDPGADDSPAPEGIPDTVLYVTVDDETLARVARDLEHATDLALDAPCDVRPRRGRKLDSIEVLRSCLLEQGRIVAPLRIRGEQAVDIGRKDRAFRTEHPGELEHHHVAGTDGDAAVPVSDDVPKRHGREAHRGKFQKWCEIRRRSEERRVGKECRSRWPAYVVKRK